MNINLVVYSFVCCDGFVHCTQHLVTSALQFKDPACSCECNLPKQTDVAISVIKTHRMAAKRDVVHVFMLATL